MTNEVHGLRQMPATEHGPVWKAEPHPQGGLVMQIIGCTCGSFTPTSQNPDTELAEHAALATLAQQPTMTDRAREVVVR